MGGGAGNTPNIPKAGKPREVIVIGGISGFTQSIQVGPHRFTADEPSSMGGTDTGLTPYDFLLAALGS